MTGKLRTVAEQAANSLWLTAAQRILSLFIAPALLAAVVAVAGLFSRATITEGELRAAQGRITALETSNTSLRAEVAAHSGLLGRLQAQREGDAQVSNRISELREDIRDIRTTLNQMLTPPRRVAP